MLSIQAQDISSWFTAIESYPKEVPEKREGSSPLRRVSAYLSYRDRLPCGKDVEEHTKRISKIKRFAAGD